VGPEFKPQLHKLQKMGSCPVALWPRLASVPGLKRSSSASLAAGTTGSFPHAAVPSLQIFEYTIIYK
jgi:hypothetical protein